ncbi:MAG: fibrobacter succinogenes major paralogous domain-containing protein [bacterium]
MKNFVGFLIIQSVIIIILTTILNTSLFAKFSIKVYFKDSTTPKEYNVTDIKRLEVSDFRDDYTDMLLYSGTTVLHSYPTNDIDSIKFSADNQMTVFTSGMDDNYSLSSLDSMIFQYSATVTLGTQTWTRMNLNVTHYRNGDSIPEVRGYSDWVNQTTGAWCSYNNDPANDAIYGKLYNWYAVVDSRGLAPEGWHVPSDDGWKTLEMYLGMSQSQADEWDHRGTDEASKLSGRADLWTSGVLTLNQNFGSSGFSGFPSGIRYFDYGYFDFRGNLTILWSSSEFTLNPQQGVSRTLRYNNTKIYRKHEEKYYGISVRCVKD